MTLGDLPEVAQEWSSLSGAERASWSHDWDQVMGELEAILYPRYRAGTLTPDQQVRYRQLTRQLRDSLPLVGRLKLYRPDLPLDA